MASCPTWSQSPACFPRLSAVCYTCSGAWLLLHLTTRLCCTVMSGTCAPRVFDDQCLRLTGGCALHSWLHLWPHCYHSQGHGLIYGPCQKRMLEHWPWLTSWMPLLRGLALPLAASTASSRPASHFTGRFALLAGPLPVAFTPVLPGHRHFTLVSLTFPGHWCGTHISACRLQCLGLIFMG